MTSKELAVMLDGNQYGSEIDRVTEKVAADNGLVVVFGYSDDNVELRGAIDDEVGAFDGTTFHVTRSGVIGDIDDTDDDKRYEIYQALSRAEKITAVWHDTGEPCWTYETEIPHDTFRVLEGEELFCVGIVFNIGDLPV